MTPRRKLVVLGVALLAVTAVVVPALTRSSTGGVGGGTSAPRVDSTPTRGRPDSAGGIFGSLRLEPPRPGVEPSPDAARRPGRHAPQPPMPGLYRTTGGKAVALTFDDGPDPAWTPRVLAMLRVHRVKATFCLIGAKVVKYPALVRAIVADGHTLCNHTFRHDLKLAAKKPDRIAYDLRMTNALIVAASGGIRPRFFRAPGGRWSPRIVTLAKSLGMAALHWSVDPQDWRRPPAAAIVQRVRAAVRPGGVVLLHDGGGNRGATYLALRTLLPELNARFGLKAL